MQNYIQTVLLPNLDKVRKTGTDQWQACCPVHGDRSPSLGITIKDGKILMNCFSCGANGMDVVKSLGLSVSDLFESDKPWHFSGTSRKEQAQAKQLDHQIWRAQTRLQITKAAKENGETITESDMQKAKNAYKFLKEVEMI